LRRLAVIAVIVFVLGLVADVGLKAMAESQIETTAKREAPDASADAAIPVFPFLPPLLLAGKVDEVSLHLANISAGSTVIERLDFDLHGVEISRRALFEDREVKLQSIDRGTVTALMPLPAAARNLPLDGLTARVRGRTLVVSGPGGISVPLPMPRTSLMPCDGTATIVGGRVRVSCTLEEIPPALVEAINQAN
jgi:hypothetical protein